jgi:hypothetical protein
MVASFGLGVVLCWSGAAPTEDPNPILDSLAHKRLTSHEDVFVTQRISGGRIGSHSQPGVVSEDRLRIFADSMFKF